MIWQTTTSGLPGNLRYMPGAPQTLYVAAGDKPTFDDLMTRPRIAVVGTRLASPYGRQVTVDLVTQLAARGIVTISGLAIGIDAIAHQAALQAGGLTLAVLPNAVSHVYPRCHETLARQIIDNNGALVSEYAPGSETYKTNFIARNRIVAGLADALLITEAAEKSGTMHTANFAIDQGIDVLAVPGNITSPTSAGTNNLIKQNKAAAVTNIADILFALNLPDTRSHAKNERTTSSNPSEQAILNLLEQGVSDGNELLHRSDMPVSEFNNCLTMLELTAKIRALGANQWGLA